MVVFARLGRALRLLRERLGKSQKEVAAAAGVTAPMLSAFERERTRPELKSLDRILAHGLGASLADLAWALDVVNERQPAATGHRTSEAEARGAPEGLAGVLGHEGRGAPPALEAGCAQIVGGLVQISRFVLEEVARAAAAEARRPGKEPPAGRTGR